MKRTLDDHAARFDDKAATYDDGDRPVYEVCANLVIEHATPRPSDTVLDLGTGTGAIALGVARTAAQVIGRDISTNMLTTARENASEQGVTNVSFGNGRFRDPKYDGDVDIVTSNYAMHHLDDQAKHEAIRTIAEFAPRQFVLGDLMLFEEANPAEPDFDPSVDDPATVDVLVASMTKVGFHLTQIERVTDQAGVIVAASPRGGWE